MLSDSSFQTVVSYLELIRAVQDQSLEENLGFDYG